MKKQIKKINIGKRIVSAVLAIILFAGIGVGAYFMIMGTDKATSVMEVSVNPNVQLLLNNQDRVVAVNYLNEDGQKLLINTNLVGKTAEDAASIIIDLSVQSGYISVNTTGTKVEITVSNEAAEKITSIQNKAIEAVNKYFDKNGIVAGAVAKTKADLQTAATNLGVSVEKYYAMLKLKAIDSAQNLSDLKKYNEAEILAMIKDLTADLKDIAYTNYSSFTTKLANLKTILNNAIDGAQAIIDSTQEQINNNPDMPSSIKEPLNKTIDNAQKAIDEARKTFEENFNNFVATLKENSKATIEAIKTEMTTAISNAKQTIATHKEYFEANKTAVETAIANYRATL